MAGFFKKESGSVLMEFIVVLPLYFLLIGFVFVIGEISLHTIRIGASADRSYALSVDDGDSHSIGLRDGFLLDAGVIFDEFTRFMTFDYDKNQTKADYGYSTSDFEAQRVDCVADGGFAAPWVKGVGAATKDNYRLTPLAHGFAAFWYRETKRRISAMGDGSGGGEDSAVDGLIGADAAGNADVRGKDLVGMDGDIPRNHAYVSLQRNEAGRWNTEDEKKPYRAWSESALVHNDVWLYKVAAEPDASARHNDIRMNSGLGPEAEPAGGPGYERYTRFDEWTD